MWALLSTRLRTWLLFAVAVPVVRSAVHHAARRAAAGDPTTRTSRTLSRVDSGLARLDRRRPRPAR